MLSLFFCLLVNKIVFYFRIFANTKCTKFGMVFIFVLRILANSDGINVLEGPFMDSEYFLCESVVCRHYFLKVLVSISNL